MERKLVVQSIAGELNQMVGQFHSLGCLKEIYQAVFQGVKSVYHGR